ncbi:MAG: acetate--CoA ligase family protein [Dehalococcoidia bacterium]
MIQQMRLFLEPRSIALVGASRRTGDGNNVFENLKVYGFPGKLYPVNPRAEEILGERAYPSVSDIPEVPDLALISTPRASVPQMVGECVAKGIKAIIIVAQGLADADDEGRRLQEEAVRIAREGGARLLGPNTFGTANAFCHLNTAFIFFPMEKVPVASISQSGFLFGGTPRQRLVGKAIDLGNSGDIGFTEALEYFGADPDIKVIVLYVESIRNGRQFLEVARRVAEKKPIIALKGGVTPLGAEAAQSHTGSLTGRNEVYEAAFRQCGIIQAGDVDELEDLVVSFLHLPVLRGRRLGVMTITMGAGVLAADACARHGMELASLSSRTRAKLAELLPPWLGASNPVDLGPSAFTPWGSKEVMRQSLEALLTDPGVDAVLLVVSTNPMEVRDITAVTAPAVEAHPEKPVVSWVYNTDIGEEISARYRNAGKMVVYLTLGRAMKALSRVAGYWERRNRADGP